MAFNRTKLHIDKAHSHYYNQSYGLSQPNTFCFTIPPDQTRSQPNGIPSGNVHRCNGGVNNKSICLAIPDCKPSTSQDCGAFSKRDPWPCCVLAVCTTPATSYDAVRCFRLIRCLNKLTEAFGLTAFDCSRRT